MLRVGEDELPSEPYVLYMSTLSEDGVMAVKQTACDRLLASRVEQKLQVRLCDLLLWKEAPLSSHKSSKRSEDGVMAVKQTACDRLLASRVEQKLQVGVLSRACVCSLQAGTDRAR